MSSHNTTNHPKVGKNFFVVTGTGKSFRVAEVVVDTYNSYLKDFNCTMVGAKGNKKFTSEDLYRTQAAATKAAKSEIESRRKLLLAELKTLEKAENNL